MIFFRRCRLRRLESSLSITQKRALREYRIAHENRKREKAKYEHHLHVALALVDVKPNWPEIRTEHKKFYDAMKPSNDAFTAVHNECNNVGVTNHMLKLLVGDEWLA